MCFSEQSFEKPHAGSDAGAEAYRARQPVFRGLPGLCADSPKRTGVARPEGSIGPEPQRVELLRHFPFKGVIGPTQRTTTRIDSSS